MDYITIGVIIASVVLVLVTIKHGYTERLYAASALFFRLAVSFLVAMTFYRALAYMVVTKTSLLSEYMAIRLSFLVLLWGVYLGLTELYERWMEPEHVIVHRVIDRVGGMLFGALAGALLVGLLLLTWANLPVARIYRPMPLDESKLPIDMGKVLIEEYANLSNRMKSPGGFDRHAEIAAYRALDEQPYIPEHDQVAKPKNHESVRPKSENPAASRGQDTQAPSSIKDTR